MKNKHILSKSLDKAFREDHCDTIKLLLQLHAGMHTVTLDWKVDTATIERLAPVAKSINHDHLGDVAMNGNLALFRLLVEMFALTIDSKILARAITSGNTALINYIEDHGVLLPPADAFDVAASCGHIELMEKYGIGSHVNYMILSDVIWRDYPDAMRWLMQRHTISASEVRMLIPSVKSTKMVRILLDRMGKIDPDEMADIIYHSYRSDKLAIPILQMLVRHAPISTKHNNNIYGTLSYAIDNDSVAPAAVEVRARMSGIFALLLSVGIVPKARSSFMKELAKAHNKTLRDILQLHKITSPTVFSSFVDSLLRQLRERGITE